MKTRRVMTTLKLKRRCNAMVKTYTCHCHVCDRDYQVDMETEDAEVLFEQYDPTDYTCEDCVLWQRMAEDAQIHKLQDELEAKYYN